MIRDGQTAIWEAAALTVTAVSTNCYDCGAVPSGGSANGEAPDPSVGEPMCFILVPTVAADHTTGDETYEFDIIIASASDLTTNQLVIGAFVITYDLLAAGRVVVLPIRPGSVTKRYLGLKYVGGGTTPTITVDAWIAPMSMVHKYKHYTTLINIL